MKIAAIVVLLALLSLWVFLNRKNTSIGLGDSVQCVNDEWPEGILDFVWELPVKGRVYRVRGLGYDPRFKISGLYLEEIVNPLHPNSMREWGFNADRFKLLKKNK